MENNLILNSITRKEFKILSFQLKCWMFACTWLFIEYITLRWICNRDNSWGILTIKMQVIPCLPSHLLTEKFPEFCQLRELRCLIEVCLEPIKTSTTDEFCQMRELRCLIEAYLEPSQTSTTEVFCENSQRLLDVNYFRKKAPSSMLDWVLHTPHCVKVPNKHHRCLPGS